ncbi:MAG TPA: hypothetical protein VN372_15545 [Methanospirillum sp.]|nr:hypothetical protein [Methanospirillum sp.]
MAGKIQALIDEIIEIRSHGNPGLASTTKAKLLLKGIDPNKYNSQSPDDPVIIAKVRQCAQEMGIEVNQ